MNMLRYEKLPDVTKNLIILNAVVFLATSLNGGLLPILGLYSIFDERFNPYQLVTHLFTHANLMHIFFNMFTLYMFGRVLENVLGPKRFAILYFATGLGAVLLNVFLDFLQLQGIINFNTDVNISFSIGASGAVYGIMVAFAMLFPNTELLIYFIVPLKAKVFIPLLILAEIYMEVSRSPGDNVGHAAHLGGALIGFIVIKIWSKDRTRFY
ncbi:MAG: rhomboid family intramembrane serine protease [Bacteroidetes bacterium]|nr:rhomboid family intramembrane serine protease [Bacteroidota bacterium]MBK9633239.1 rhomboid family intramembrane serine protease [Bacteroidota bacterium]MBL0286249.1 rhomboid family intramembrane serine protease [Bacteroidota bacterium]